MGVCANQGYLEEHHVTFSCNTLYVCTTNEFSKLLSRENVIRRKVVRNLPVCKDDVIRKLPIRVSGWLQLHQGRRHFCPLLLLRLRLLQLHLQHGLTNNSQLTVRFRINGLCKLIVVSYRRLVQVNSRFVSTAC